MAGRSNIITEAVKKSIVERIAAKYRGGEKRKTPLRSEHRRASPIGRGEDLMQDGSKITGGDGHLCGSSEGKGRGLIPCGKDT